MESWVVGWIRTNGLGIWIEFLFRDPDRVGLWLMIDLCKRPEAEASTRTCAFSLSEVCCAFQTTLPTPGAEADLTLRERLHHWCLLSCMCFESVFIWILFFQWAPFQIPRFSYLISLLLFTWYVCKEPIFLFNLKLVKFLFLPEKWQTQF